MTRYLPRSICSAIVMAYPIYLLDTNILSALVRNPAGRVRGRIAESGEHTVCTRIYG